MQALEGQAYPATLLGFLAAFMGAPQPEYALVRK